ncbi:MAG: helix-turn-helix domain-containing protein [Kiloniellales bacterium]|nr:helix-turn-helix domain-containing protein [Kiloniellales bacterium]
MRQSVQGAEGGQVEDVKEIGERLRTVRLRYGLSQRKLAGLSGVSNASISLIEKGRLNPSIGMLLKILGGFPLSLPEFWEVDVTPRHKHFYRFAELSRIESNKVSYWQVGDSSPKSQMIFQYERYEPGMDGKEVRAKRDCEMAGLIIEGRIEITIGNQSRILGPGDAYRFNGRLPHRIRVVSKAPAVAVSCTVPPAF